MEEINTTRRGGVNVTLFGDETKHLAHGYKDSVRVVIVKMSSAHDLVVVEGEVEGDKGERAFVVREGTMKRIAMVSSSGIGTVRHSHLF